MPQSMTGFATAEQPVGSYLLTWELRSVNHRFLDLSVRLPEELRAAEPACRELMSRRIKRGKLDASLKVASQDLATSTVDIDAAAVAALAALAQRVRETMPEAAPLSVAEVLRWSGVLREQRLELEVLEKPMLACLARAVEALHAARAREGARIAEFMEQRNAAILGAIKSVRPSLGRAAERYRQKLLDRLARLDLEAQPERLEQELVVIAQRIDVSEELDRLASHVAEIRAVLTGRDPMGRRLDFLIQELNREANTLGSKSQDEELTKVSVELKVLIEQMREQAQNLE